MNILKSNMPTYCHCFSTGLTTCGCVTSLSIVYRNQIAAFLSTVLWRGIGAFSCSSSWSSTTSYRTFGPFWPFRVISINWTRVLIAFFRFISWSQTLAAFSVVLWRWAGAASWSILDTSSACDVTVRPLCPLRIVAVDCYGSLTVV